MYIIDFSVMRHFSKTQYIMKGDNIRNRFVLLKDIIYIFIYICIQRWQSKI